jgi:hypothetical protein
MRRPQIEATIEEKQASKKAKTIRAGEASTKKGHATKVLSRWTRLATRRTVTDYDHA